jgi:hypothetical protein
LSPAWRASSNASFRAAFRNSRGSLGLDAPGPRYLQRQAERLAYRSISAWSSSVGTPSPLPVGPVKLVPRDGNGRLGECPKSFGVDLEAVGRGPRGAERAAHRT